MRINKKNGFTLAELLIVVAIIGVLTAVAIPVFSSQLEKSREATDIANLRSAKAAAVSKYLADDLTEGTYYFDAQKGVLVSSADLASNPISGYGKGTDKNGATGNSFETSAIANGTISMSWVDTDGTNNERNTNYASDSDVSGQIIKITFGVGSGSGGSSNPGGNTGGSSSEPIIAGSATFNDGVTLSWEELQDTANGTKYGYDASKITVTSVDIRAFDGCTSLTSINIPDGVTSIGIDAFSDCSSLTSINIPDSVTIIDIRAFDGCSSLTSINIPDGVTSIGNDTFSGCSSLTSIIIPDSVTNINTRAFDGCTSLTSIIIPDGVTSIGNDAFSGCSSLTNITIPNSVTSIDMRAFDGCSALTDINYTGTKAQWNAITKGTSWDSGTGNYTVHCTDGNIPDIIGSATFNDGVTLTWAELQDANNGTNYGYYASEITDTSIGNIAFSGCTNLTSVTIPDSVTSIGDSAFNWCRSLTSVTIPDSVTSIGNSAFSWCDNLTSIEIPSSVTSIGTAFCSCSKLTEINVEASNTNYSSENGILFNKDKTALVCYPAGKTETSYEIPSSVTSVGECAFYGCFSLANITIPDSVQSIESYTFQYCSSLISITIGNSVTSIGNNAFYYCDSLTEINVDENNTSYASENGVLFNKDKTTLVCYPKGKATSYTIPNSVTSIGNYAFSSCDNLTSITIPNSVTSIGGYAFSNCTSLTDINFNGTQVQWNSITFGEDWNNDTGTYTIHCTDGDISK